MTSVRIARFFLFSFVVAASTQLTGCADDNNPHAGTWSSIQGTSTRTCDGVARTTPIQPGTTRVTIVDADGALHVTIPLDAYACSWAAADAANGTAISFRGDDSVCVVGDGSLTLTAGSLVFTENTLNMSWSIDEKVSTGTCKSESEMLAQRK